jgi:hypothetical protein
MSRIVNVFLVGLIVLLACAASQAAMRTDAKGNIVWDKSHIDLTLKVSDDISGVAKVELWYRKQGGTWQKYAHEPKPGRNPGQYIIGFDAPDDGIYEFYSVSIDKVGNSSGAPTEMTQPRIVVNFDTKPPELQVAFEKEYKTAAPGSTINFNWIAQDDNLKSVVVRYYWDGAADKPSLQPLMGDSGTYSIAIPAEGVSKLTMLVAAEDYAGHTVTTQTFAFDVKAAAPAATTEPKPVTETKSSSPPETNNTPPENKDTTGKQEPKAKQETTQPETNDTEKTPSAKANHGSDSNPSAATEPLGNQTTPPKPDANHKSGSSAKTENAAGKPKEPKEPDIKPTALQVAIKYDVVQSGATGLDRVELWFTKVGAPDWKKKWNLYQFSTTGKGTFIFEAPEIAEYGFYIIAQNRAGQWSKPRPDGQTEIEPDYTKWVDPYAPFLKVISPKTGECMRGGSEVAVRWVANDDNLLEKPIKIELYSGGRSVLVVENATENTGSHSFLFPYKSGKYSIRVTATDRAGHVTEGTTGEFFIDSGNITVSIQVLEEEYVSGGMGVDNSDSSTTGTGGGQASEEPKSYAPETKGPMTDKEARDAFTKGMSVKAQGNLEQGMELLKQAATHFPKDDMMVNEYGIALYELKRYNEALEQFARALALAPSNAGYQWNIFLADLGLKDVDGSAKAALDVLAADPNRAEARSMIDAVVKLFDDAKRGSEVNAWLKKVIGGSHITDGLKAYVQSRMR